MPENPIKSPVKPPPQPIEAGTEEFKTLVYLAKRAIWANLETRRELNRYGINIVPANFYSEIPTVDSIEESFEFQVAEGPYNSPRVFDPTTLRYFLSQIDVYADEFSPPPQGDKKNPAGYFWGNPAFSFSDAMAYYCVIRHFKPQNILEIGSGFSTLVALEAIEKNGFGKLHCIEPFPMDWLESMGEKINLIRSPVQTIDPQIFNSILHNGDILFIDSTHTVKAGSDCLHIYLRILPEITANLMIHAHDINLPFPLAKSQFDRHVYWTEQYLLYAYLINNSHTQVVYGSAYNHKFNSVELKSLMRGRWPAGGASLWWSQAGSEQFRVFDESATVGTLKA